MSRFYTPERRYKPPARNSDRAKANATCLLYGCTDAAFARLTAESLARDFALSLKQAEYMLTLARNKRGAV